MQYRVLGSIELEDHRGRPLRLNGAKQRALLAIFLLHANEVVSPDRLIDDLWGAQPPGDGRAALAMQISRLRKILHRNGERILLTHPNGYLLRIAPGELDLHRLERLLENGFRSIRTGRHKTGAETLRRALALWRGRPFDDISYEPFVQTEIARLEERRVTALEERVEADLALGRHVELVAELEALVRQHPLRERLSGQLMLALYRVGRQAEALRVYRATRGTLVEELGIEPGPALRQLEQAILRQDAELDRASAATGGGAGQRRPRILQRRRLLWSCHRRLTAPEYVIPLASRTGMRTGNDRPAR